MLYPKLPVYSVFVCFFSPHNRGMLRRSRCVLCFFLKYPCMTINDIIQYTNVHFTFYPSPYSSMSRWYYYREYYYTRNYVLLTVFWLNKERTFFLRTRPEILLFLPPIRFGSATAEAKALIYTITRIEKKNVPCFNQEVQWLKKTVQMVSTVARKRFVS